MKKSMIRFLSLVLCLVSLASLLPTTALAAEVAGTPTKLKWNTDYYLDGNGDPVSYSSIGYISFKANEPYGSDYASFNIKLYRDGKKILDENWSWYSEYAKSRQGYLSLDLNSHINKSGTYYFTIKSLGYIDDSGAEVGPGSTVKSKTWTYTVPSKKVSKPSNVKIDWPYVTWTHNKEEYPQYEIEIKFSEKKDGTYTTLGNMSSYGSNEVLIPFYYGSGYYSVRVRSISDDITTRAHSSWVALDPVYCKFKGPQLTLSGVSSSGKIKLSWDMEKMTDEEASWYIEKYNIYRATSKDGEYKKIASTTKTTYTDTSAKAGKKYYYKVKAVAYGGETSYYSNALSRHCDLARPDVTISLKNGDPKLNWKKIEGAKEYQVYRATSKNGEYKLMKTTTNTYYINTSAKAGTTYYYKVKAIHSNSSANSAFSSVDSIKAK